MGLTEIFGFVNSGESGKCLPTEGREGIQPRLDGKRGGENMCWEIVDIRYNLFHINGLEEFMYLYMRIQIPASIVNIKV